jgi:hydroxyethylthiazole kinase
VERAAALVGGLRARAPRVHCITNGVAQAFTANVLLAAGAVPSMTTSPEEVGAFVQGCDALLVNLGTLDGDRRAGIEVALAAAGEAGRPFVLDPVFVDRSPARLAFARMLAARGPAVIRLNGAEFQALTGGASDRDNLSRHAARLRTTIALTGARDEVADADRHVALANGDPLMGKVTAMGCAGSALVAAAIAVEPDPFLAAAGALVMLGVAGEIAARESTGPGSFAAAILDALDALRANDVRALARVSP